MLADFRICISGLKDLVGFISKQFLRNTIKTKYEKEERSKHLQIYPNDM